MSSVSSSLASTLKRLQNKVAIITGGASGIGASTARVFHGNGAKVVIADIQDNKGKSLAEELGPNASFIHCDVSNENDVRNLVDSTTAKQGKLDIMYNNAGILGSTMSSIPDKTKFEIDQVIGVNLVGSMFGAKHAARVMMSQRNGCILFTASVCTAISGLLASNAYVASKYGILGLTKNLAAELGPYGIRVNCVSPYAVATPMAAPDQSKASELEESWAKMSNLKGESLKAEGVANAALYLASDEANYVGRESGNFNRRSKRIGATTATLFHKNGAKVIIADIQDTKGEALANKLGEDACYIHCDVTKEDDIRNLTDAAIAKHGKLDIMYSNAGILDRPLSCIMDTPKSEIDQIIGINLEIRIVVSKYGVLGLTKNLAAELGQHGIRVNCISPYGVATPLIVPNEAEITSMEMSLAAMGNLKGEILKPEGVAQAALYLASDEANYVSGLNLVVDGGFSIS
ncbi:Short-chain dehydrogenase/reductase SDR [Corchorus capsularis]|uniref:Short-chain dehydrogenase/reductase SDR n=1 Tax=Corchorus capsularis TaxID=210143 RepID=A0A1R3IIP6_COCAP|nr:Short-chain dehydrogenase/reductase SDR [Corchorus capsularis]